MIVLDTNVLSEALKPSPAESPMRWLAAQDPLAIFITTITQAELLYGVELLPSGKRRSALSSAIEKLFAVEFAGRILPFDEDAARVFPKVVAHREKLGRPISQFDAMIASICPSHGATLATRNLRDFEHCNIPLVNPWS
ncbi:MAG: type II toxin-antitoxin system VapC family toxin [Bryobacteraceae bacterium]